MINRELELNNQKLKEFMRLKPTLADTAAFFEVSERTIERYVKDNFTVTFKVFREQYMVHTRMKLVRQAIEMATKGNVAMLIFCLKNLCGWVNEPPKAPGEDTPPTVILSDEQMATLVKAARGNK